MGRGEMIMDQNEMWGKVNNEMIEYRLLSLPPWITNSGCVNSHMSIESYLSSLEPKRNDIDLQIISTKKTIDLRGE